MNNQALYLTASILALGAGPLIHGWINARRQRLFNVAAVLAIVFVLFVDIIPHSFEAAGWAAIAFLIAGFLVALLVERRVAAQRAHKIIIDLAVLSAIIHSLYDGVALSGATAGLATIIILHQIPIGAGIWLLKNDRRAVYYSLIVVTTLFGFVLGSATLPDGVFGPKIAHWFQAFVAGTLLHIFLHHCSSKHNHQCHI